MKIATINMPEPILAQLEALVEIGIYPNRSEALRVALREFLAREMKFAAEIGADKVPATSEPRETVEVSLAP